MVIISGVPIFRIFTVVNEPLIRRGSSSILSFLPPSSKEVRSRSKEFVPVGVNLFPEKLTSFGKASPPEKNSHQRR